MACEPFEVGNTVFAAGRLSTVEKVFKNGNFKIAGIEGQWRQGGYRAGDTGYRTAKCEHYTQAVADREAARRLRVKLSELLHDAGRLTNRLQGVSDDNLKAAIEAVGLCIEKIRQPPLAAPTSKEP